jgi:ribosome-binding protein aMBF1 (putative translation factor)
MKREPKEYKIKEIYPRFFWTKCDICGNEFKKESIWKVGHTDHNNYICKECAPTYEDAEIYAKRFPSGRIIQLPLRSTKNVPPAKANKIPPPPPQPKPLRQYYEGLTPTRDIHSELPQGSNRLDL